MRTNVVIDDELMQAAQKVKPLATKRTLVEEGLRLLVLLGKQQNVRSLRGKLNWEGNLEEMRMDNGSR